MTLPSPFDLKFSQNALCRYLGLAPTTNQYSSPRSLDSCLASALRRRSVALMSSALPGSRHYPWYCFKSSKMSLGPLVAAPCPRPLACQFACVSRSGRLVFALLVLWLLGSAVLRMTYDMFPYMPMTSLCFPLCPCDSAFILLPLSIPAPNTPPLCYALFRLRLL